MNRNNNGIGETLFWKVFSNIYLLKYIIKKIQNTEWIIYENYRQIGKENRWKFKDIYSLDWMIEKKQFPLLRNKIENDDYIHFNIKTVDFLFEHYSKITGRIIIEPIKSPIKPKVKTDKEIQQDYLDKQNDIQSLKNILIQLLDFKRDEFEMVDLTKAAVKYDCLDALRILVNEPYSIVVYPSTLELAIEDCHPSMVQELLSLKQTSTQCNLVTEKVRLSSLKLASKNIDHANEMVKFILDNPNLYTTNTTTSNSNGSNNKMEKEDQSDDQPSKRFKSSHDNDIEMDELKEPLAPPPQPPLLSVSIPPTSSSESTTSTSILDYSVSFKDFIKLPDYKSKEKLMELDIVSKKDDVIFNVEHHFNIEQTFEEILILLKIHFKYSLSNGYNGTGIPKPIEKKIQKIIKKYQTSTTTDNNSQQQSMVNNTELEIKKLKELQRFIIMEFKPVQFYKSYIMKYNDSIDKFQSDNDGFYSECYDEEESKILSIFRWIGIGGFRQYFGDTLYKTHLNRSMIKFKKEGLKWHPILSCWNNTSKVMKISSKETVDWIKNCNCEMINTFIDRCSTSIEYSSVEISNYARDKQTGLTNLAGIYSYSEPISLVKKSNLIVNILYDAVKECNLNTIGGGGSGGTFETEENFKLTQFEQSGILKLVDYFNSTGYKQFTMFSFYKLFKKIVQIVTPVSSVVVDFSNCQGNIFSNEEVKNWLINSVLALDFKMSEIYISILKSIQFSNIQLAKFNSTERKMFDKNKSIFHHYDYDANELVSSFKLLMVKFNNRKNNSGGGDNGGKDENTTATTTITGDSDDSDDSDEDVDDNLEKVSYQAIFNYYFQILIQINGVSIDLVYLVYKLMVDNSIDLQHSSYHSFYYLQLRSAKFTKYLLSRPGLDEFFEVQGESSYNSSFDYGDIDGEEMQGFNFQKYLNIDEFTYDFILGGNSEISDDGSGWSTRLFNNSFDQILNRLVDNLSLSLVVKQVKSNIIRDFFNESLNADLKYFLDIKRFDLFFSHLDFIQKQLDKSFQPGYQSNIEGFPVQYLYHDSPATALISSSTLFTNRELPTKPPLMLNTIVPSEFTQDHGWKNGLLVQPAFYTNSFELAEDVVDLASMVMDIDSLQRLIEFKFHVNQFHDSLFSRSIWWSKFESAAHLLNNYDIQLFNTPLYSVESHYNYQEEFKFVAENYFEKVRDPRLFKHKLQTFSDEAFSLVFLNKLIDHLSNSTNFETFQKFKQLESRQETLDNLILLLRKKYCKVDIDLSTSNNGEATAVVASPPTIVPVQQPLPQPDNDEDEEIDEGEEVIVADPMPIETATSLVNKNPTEKEKRIELQKLLQQDDVQLMIYNSIGNFLKNGLLKREKDQEKQNRDYIELEDSMFNESFIIGNLRMCKLVLKYYPQLFKITKKSVKLVIKNNRIHVIKYFYNPKNCVNLINSFQTDPDLLQFLKDELLNHPDYKYDLNWL